MGDTLAWIEQVYMADMYCTRVCTIYRGYEMKYQTSHLNTPYDEQPMARGGYWAPRAAPDLSLWSPTVLLRSKLNKHAAQWDILHARTHDVMDLWSEQYPSEAEEWAIEASMETYRQEIVLMTKHKLWAMERQDTINKDALNIRMDQTSTNRHSKLRQSL